MRHALYDELRRLGTPGNWEHIINQIGMFSYTGLTREQIKTLRDDYHIYMLDSGRASISGCKFQFLFLLPYSFIHSFFLSRALYSQENPADRFASVPNIQ